MTKDCRDKISNLNDFIDGTLEPELCREITEHLGSCNECRIMVNTLEQTVRLTCDGKEKPIPPALEAKLNAKLKERWEKKFGKKG